jgi:hypothetical protein
MADEDFEADDPAERARHFFESYGVSELMYSETVQAAIAHATAAGRPNLASPPWVNVGPRNVAGRILCIAQDPKNPLVVWAGSAHGGLWRTIDGGDTWEHVGTPKENFPVATIAIPDDDPTTVYVGTGSVVNRFPGGGGLFKVTAPAPTQPAAYNYPPLAAAPTATTSPAAATNGSASHYARIRMDPYDSRRFWIASMTGLWRYESFAAPPFTLEFPIAAPPFPMPALSPGAAPPPGQFGGWPNYACDVVVARDPTSSDTEGGKPRYLFVYVAINGQGVFRGRFDRRGAGSMTWQKQLGPFPGQPASFGRIALAVCRNFPQNVYAVFEDTANSNVSTLQTSIDSGDNWASQTAIPAAAQGQADYDLVLEVNPDHPAKLFCGAVELCYSEDTGNTWSPLTVFGFYDGGDHANHSDHHALVFDALDRTRVWSGNDGGLVLADDIRGVPRPRFWRHRSHGIVAGQFNAIDVNPRFPFITGGGLQDNGSWVGFGGPTWMRSGGGDGGQTAFNTGNPRQWVITWQNHADAASIILNVPAVSPAFLPPGLKARVNPTMPDLPIGVMEERKDTYPIAAGAPFVPRIVEHPGAPGVMLLSGNSGTGSLAFWLNAAPAAPPHGTPLPAPGLLAPAAILPGGLVLMNNAEASAVAIGPLINNITDAWIGTDDGQVLVAVNSVGQPTPFVLTAPLPLPGGIRQVLADIAVHPGDPRTVAVAAIPDGNDSVTVTFMGPGAPGAVQPSGTVTFTYTIGGITGVFGVGGVGGAPIVTRGGGGGMVLLGTTLILTFSAANTFVVGDTFTIDALGGVTPGGGGSTGNVTAASTNGQVVTISVATPGALGVATFNMSVGGANFSGNPIPMAARVLLPGTFVDVFFPGGGPAYQAGSSWTIAANGAVVSTGAAGSPLPSAVVHPGGRVYMTWDRGANWTDITFTTAALPRPSPDLLALPPAPVSALAWNPTGTPATGLLAGTLAGVYATGGVPAPAANGLVITPAGPISIRAGAANALQLRASLQMTSGGTIDVTNQVDWSVPAVGAHVTVTPGGLVTGVNAGLTVVTARRGVESRTINVTVAAGAPATPAPAPALPLLVPAVNPGWAPLNQAIPPNPNNEGLPLTLINDITVIGTRVRVATFGRGIWDAEMAPAAQTQRRLYIRQTAVEDGVTYPRVLPVVGVPPPPPVVGGPAPAAPTLATDPRVPQAPAVAPFVAPTVTLDFTHAFDIRIDTAPFRFFDDRIDGVEFEQQIGVGLGAPASLPPKRPLTATEKAVVYVQVLDSGFDRVDNVDVHLYYFPLAAPIAGGLFPPAGVPLPALNPVTDFYNPPNFDPPAPPNPAMWRRVAPRRQLARVSPTAPAVARFDWEPDASLGGQDVALLAMCTSVNDPLPAAPAGGGAVAAFLQQERRASLRIVSVAAVPATSIYIRDGIDDDGRNGAVAFAGRSPDIIVVQAPPVAPATPEQTFADLLDQRPQSRVTGGVANTIYVRVHNRSVVVADAQVELWAVPVEANNQTHATPPAAAPWLQLWPPAGPLPPPLHVPANGWALQPVTWNNPPDPFAAAPAASKAWVLVALVSAGAGDAKPDVTRINGVDGLWQFLRRQRDSENAAARALRYDP